VSAYFCGNPQNHVAHIKDGQFCGGVSREEKPEEVIIEKFEPDVDEKTEAEDATPYSKVTIIVENPDGSSTMLQSERVTNVNIDVEYQTYLNIQHLRENNGLSLPAVDHVTINFDPRPEEDQAPFTVYRKEKE
jgi:hypothetical protein